MDNNDNLTHDQSKLNSQEQEDIRQIENNQLLQESGSRSDDEQLERDSLSRMKISSSLSSSSDSSSSDEEEENIKDVSPQNNSSSSSSSEGENEKNEDANTTKQENNVLPMEPLQSSGGNIVATSPDERVLDAADHDKNVCAIPHEHPLNELLVEADGNHFNGDKKNLIPPVQDCDIVPESQDDVRPEQAIIPRNKADIIDEKENQCQDELPDLSDSSSSSGDENSGPLVIRQQKELPDEQENLAQSLKRALEEREKMQQQPENPLHFEDSEFASDVDDMSIKARTAGDFVDNEAPPALPPKLSKHLSTRSPKPPPKENSFGRPLLHVTDKTDTMPRGRWSDDEESIVPTAHRIAPVSAHPPPDRIIDFSQSPGLHSNSKKKDRRKHKNGLSTQPDDDAFKRPALVSLHSSNATNIPDLVEPYDSTNENEDLNKLIQEVNSLDINVQKEQKVDVLYPSYQQSLPPKQNLVSSYPDVFSKLANSGDKPVSVTNSIEPETEPFRAIPQGPLNENLPILPKKRPQVEDPRDGDDEISITESHFRFPVVSNDVPKSLNAIPYMCEVYPSDYTDFETASETDANNDPTLANPLHHDITPYDTVADFETDWDTPKPSTDENLNPIVSDDYRICSGIKKNHHTFPKRMNPDKPQPKQRTSINMMAIPLTDPSSNSRIQHSSLPFVDEAPLRRPKSNPNLQEDLHQPGVFGQVPHIVVTRGPTEKGSRLVDPFPQEPQSLPLQPPKKKTVPETKKNSQIRVSLGQNNGLNKDTALVEGSNNLRINVLPSEDPNVINLNIQTTTGATVQPIPAPRSLTPEPSPLQVQPLQPITAISHKTPSSQPSVVVVDQAQTQHRVVDVAPIIIQSSPSPQLDPVPMPVTEPTLYPIAHTAVHTEFQPVPIQAVPVQQEQLVRTVVTHPVVVTSQPLVIEQAPTQSNPPANNVVVEIEDPWQDRNKQLPEAGLRHGGDSGIDLTHYEERMRGRKHSTSSSQDSDYDVRRKSSKRRLASTADELSTNGGMPDKYVEWYKRKYLKPTCCYSFVKHFIFVLNIIFAIVGLALLGLGIWGFADLVNNGLEDPHLILLDPIFPVFIVGFVIAFICIIGAAGFFRDNICMIKFFWMVPCHKLHLVYRRWDLLLGYERHYYKIY
ncbi:uncharacterized protein LOC143469216 isoform X3 [Clavelina lepadiformis]|uniref:uncharacterized protein LOC143469216 isoform X3 n=1 Tax=Clavelina lepadiformis TaxID=159417 RepID=UPI004043116A